MKKSFKCFFLFLALTAIFFSGAEIIAILVVGHPRSISEKLFLNRPIGLGDVVLRCLLVLSLAAILFS